MTLKPGSIPWLAAHELRVLLREMQRDKARVVQWVMLAIFMVALLACGVGLGFLIRETGLPPISPMVVTIVDLAVLVMFSIMVASTLARGAQVLYLRDDLDLLFSSPLPARRILAVRFGGIAFSVSVFWLFIAFGLVVPIAILGDPRLLAVLPVLLSLGLLSSAAGLLLTTLLFHLIGPRRTRVLAQVLSALIGASVFLAFQLPNILRGVDPSYSRMGWIRPFLTGEAHLDLPPHADLLARAMLGEPLPLLIVVGVCVGVFLLVTQGLGRRFARDVASAVGSDAGRRKAGKTGGFAAGAFAATLRKELRLLLRDIALFSQVLLRVFYMLPLAFIFVRNASEGHSLLLPGGAAALALMAGQLSSSFTWITVSAEDAPDLLVASPTPMSVVTRAKLWAGLIPTLALVILPILAVGLWSPWTSLVAAAGAFASAWASGMLNIWYQRPARRADFRRRGNVHWLLVIPILIVGGLIAGATFLAADQNLWAVVPAVLAAVALLALKRSDRQILDRLRSAD
ncbi:MAG: hypothetical protein Q7T61_13910 [Caulobacter sp.]|nr:hypothetical protein [Caulobacter sp.]